MSGTLWIGSRGDSRCLMMVWSGFGDTVFDLIEEHLGSREPDLIDELRDGYAYSTYLNLADLNRNRFTLVQEVIEHAFSEKLKEFIEEPSHPRHIFFLSLLKAGYATDDRSELNSETIILTYQEGEIVVPRWCIALLLEALILKESEPLSSAEISRLYDSWVHLSNPFNMIFISDLLILHAMSGGPYVIESDYIQARFSQFVGDLIRFLQNHCSD